MIDERLLYQEYLRRKGPSVLDRSFALQCKFIEDPARLKALFCTRRASKSYTAGLYMVKEALGMDAVNCLYLGLTRQSAKAIIWKDVLKDIDKKKNIGISFNGTELTGTTPNNSIIYVSGADADEDEMEKLLGRKYRLVVVDEAASFTVDLRRMIYGILKPAMTDMNGTICMMGTSGNLTKGLFFDVTTGKEPGWKLYTWSAHDNPYVAKQWQEELDEIDRDRPLFKQTPLFKQWYLNEWVIDDDKLVYKFSRDRNLCVGLPNHARGAWSYVLGVDLGYEDATAFALCAFHEHDNNLYVLETFKQSRMDITDVANRIKFYSSRYDIFRVVIDGANKQAVEEIQKRHGIALHAADKTGKSDFIEIMNAEMIQARIKVVESESKELIDEWMGLIWETDGDKIKLPRKEHPNCENHLCDAALYAWRYCYQFLSERPKEKVNIYNRDEWLAHTRKLMDESLERQIQHERAKENDEDMFNLIGAESEHDVLSYHLNKRRK